MASWGLSLATYPQDPPYAGILLGSLVSETMREEEYVRTHEPVEPVCDWGIPSIKNHFPVLQVSSLNQIINNGVASRRDCTYWTRVQIEISWLHSPGYSGYPKSWQASLRDTEGSQYISRQMSTHCLGLAIHTPISLESCCSIGNSEILRRPQCQLYNLETCVTTSEFANSIQDNSNFCRLIDIHVDVQIQ